MERSKYIPDEVKEKQKRHQDNMQILHGVYYKGVFYWHGVGQPKKDYIENPNNEVWRNLIDSPK